MSAQYKAEAPKSIKLYYFDTAGRGEVIRAIFAVGGVKFEDIRISRAEKWPQFKPSTPFGSVPVLEVDGKMVGQSVAIARLAAKLAGLSGRSVFEEALADSVVDTVSETVDGFVPFFTAKSEEEKKAASDDIMTKVIPSKLASLERFIADHNGGKEGFFCGGEMSWADMFYVFAVEVLSAVIPNCDKGFPKLNALSVRVNADPRVKAYKDSRPVKK